MFKLKFFGKKKPQNPSFNPIQSRALVKHSSLDERRSRAVKIVHAGGRVERHYMAIPAQMIIEKYPSFVLARPEIFRRPWGSIVRPDEILVPGQKYYVVPCATIEKLRRRTKNDQHPSFLDESRSMANSSIGLQTESLSVSSILVKPGPRNKGRNLHVKFVDVENNSQVSSSQFSVSYDKKNHQSTRQKHSLKEKLRVAQINRKSTRTQNKFEWEPSFNSIIE